MSSALHDDGADVEMWEVPRVKEARIEGVQWGAISAEEIIDRSVIKVTEATVNRSGVPITNGPNDLRLGTDDRQQVCGYCGHGIAKCPGHMAYVDLPLPVVNVAYRAHLLALLHCYCYVCSRPLVAKDTPRYHQLMPMDPSARVGVVKKWIRDSHAKRGGVSCPHEECGAQQPVYVEVGTTIQTNFRITEYGPDTPQFTPTDMYTMLSVIDDDDLRLFGYSPEHSHPRNWMWRVFPVMPPIIRPASKTGGGDNQLTSRISSIVKLSNDLRRFDTKTLETVQVAKYNGLLCAERVVNPNYEEPVDEKAARAAYISLCTALGGYYNSDYDSKQYHRGVASKTCIWSIYSGGKQGRYRANLLGKRVMNAARNVIGPSNGISIDEAEVPIYQCMKLTYPERVNAYNIVRLTQAVYNGPDVYPGANYVVRGEIRIDLTGYSGDRVVLRYGDEVHRHLIEGDYVTGNRQPSLHRWSVMGHRIVPVTGNTMRIHMAVTKPYNADFDGDEMNFQVARGEEERAEVQMMLASNNLIKNGSAIVCFVMHSLVSIYRIGSETSIPYDMVMQMVTESLDEGDELIHVERRPYTGREAFSLILPRNLTMRKKDVVIVDGQWREGLIDKSVANGPSGIIQVIRIDFGMKEAARFIRRAYRFLDVYGTRVRPFSFTSADTRVDIKAPEGTPDDQLRDVLGDMAMRQLESRPGRNNLIDMYRSGAKGSANNIYQICGALGGQSKFDGRPYDDFTMHYGSDAIIRRSYNDGLTPTELLTHARPCREGMASTVKKTGEVGRRHRQVSFTLSSLATMPRALTHDRTDYHQHGIRYHPQ
ncbi:MAG: hypothetical protein CMK92_04090 [Pseudomonas sp.]|nr:hypothetical protein [Pseudomonas sp.]